MDAVILHPPQTTTKAHTTMGIRGFYSQLRPLYRAKKPNAFADGTMFIDGHSMSHMVARCGDPGAMYDCKGVSNTMDMLMTEWLAAGWNIELIIFDGLTPREKMEEIDKRTRERIRDACRTNTLSLAAGCATVCYSLITQKFPEICCRIAPGECDDILASVAYNYAMKNRTTPTYILSSDSDFCAFDYPDNVTIVNPNDYYKRGTMEALTLTPTIRKSWRCAPSSAAWHRLNNMNNSHKNGDNPAYLKYAKEQQARLELYRLSSAAEYTKDPVMSRSYNVLDRADEPGAHRVVNSWDDSKTSYMYMPITCEPARSEFSFDAGRRWRSVAYEIITTQAGGHSEFFTEYGRDGFDTSNRDIPITDQTRAAYDAKSNYKYGSKEEVIKEVKGWKVEDMIAEICSEALRTSKNGERELSFDPQLLKHQSRLFLNEILCQGNPHEEPTRNRGKGMAAHSLRFYNKFFAIFMSLRLLRSAGVPLPADVELNFLDGARWQKISVEYNRSRFEGKKNGSKVGGSLQVSKAEGSDSLEAEFKKLAVA